MSDVNHMDVDDVPTRLFATDLGAAQNGPDDNVFGYNEPLPVPLDPEPLPEPPNPGPVPNPPSPPHIPLEQLPLQQFNAACIVSGEHHAFRGVPNRSVVERRIHPTNPLNLEVM